LRVVATAHTPAGVRLAQGLGPRDCGYVEVRLDALLAGRGFQAEDIRQIGPPVLLTARHPAEGGIGGFSLSRRRACLEEYLPLARAVDVELRSVYSMAPLLEVATRRRVGKVISFHDFRGTPSLERLREIFRRSRSAGADIVKIATHVSGARDLAVLLQLQASARAPLATMGMGPLGKVSRLVLAAAGSRLNYGYLDKPQVPGQWPALELVRRIGEVLP
ncbi:MAG: type I 3-dehydroquinate dehydratase, partial [Chthoniobacterales bacterium]|nr:type I 3-dehydroquinate dehydratase [Chthoniobacterales bacterium]